MSNIDKILEITCTNHDLFVDLNEKDAEKVSGGYEVFTIYNDTKYNVWYKVDGKSWTHKPGEKWIWTAYKKGIIKFDQDGRSEVKSYKKYNLANGGVYRFKDNKTTTGNPYDIELYSYA